MIRDYARLAACQVNLWVRGLGIPRARELLMRQAACCWPADAVKAGFEALTAAEMERGPTVGSGRASGVSVTGLAPGDRLSGRA